MRSNCFIIYIYIYIWWGRYISSMLHTPYCNNETQDVFEPTSYHSISWNENKPIGNINILIKYTFTWNQLNPACKLIQNIRFFFQNFDEGWHNSIMSALVKFWLSSVQSIQLHNRQLIFNKLKFTPGANYLSYQGIFILCSPNAIFSLSHIASASTYAHQLNTVGLLKGMWIIQKRGMKRN